MTPAGQVLQERIRIQGPILFSEFMDCALYHPEHGYYRRADVFGKHGDFYTAEQLQPVFGRLIAQGLSRMCAPGTRLVELGAGRGDMAPYFECFEYTPLDLLSEPMPAGMRGIVFSNEFFDSVPVNVMQNNCERRVDFAGGQFQWTPLGSGPMVETQEHRVAWLGTIDRHLVEGIVFTIDYGYTDRESVRFPEGTLMSYRKHVADDDVLRDPGTRDITAHVNFSALRTEGERLGWETLQFETLAQALLRIGEEDSFAWALEAADGAGRVRQSLQLKTLLFGMGETFRVLVQKKNGPV